MPRKDQIHAAVVNALVKDGWMITDDPFRIYYAGIDVYADLRVEKREGENGPRRVLVIEIKSFLDVSAIHSLEVALGQYTAYRTLLKAVAPDHKLYLAIADTVYTSQFQREAFQLIVQDNQVALLVVNILREEVFAWID